MDHITRSAAKRCQQRGISQQGVSVTLEYGEKRYWHFGAVIYYLSNRAVSTAVLLDPSLRHWAERLVGTAVLVDESSGNVITAFKETRGFRQIARNYRGRRRRGITRALARPRSSQLSREAEILPLAA